MPDRKIIATAALQGLLAARADEEYDPSGVAQLAVDHADALLAALGSPVDAETISATGGETPTLKDLGVSGRAVAPLKRMGVTTLAQLAVQSREDIASVKGVSDGTMDVLDALLAENGLGWNWKPNEVAAQDDSFDPETDVPAFLKRDRDEDQGDDDDDDPDLEDVL